MHLIRSIPSTYAGIFFSDAQWLGVFLLSITFLQPWVGAVGLCTVIATQYLATLLRFPQSNIQSGAYSINALLMGLGLATYIQWSWAFAAYWIVCVLFTLLLSETLLRWLGQYGVPSLSLGFTITMWLIYLSAKVFPTLNLMPSSSEFLPALLSFVEKQIDLGSFADIHLPIFWESYLKSLGTIFFQKNLFICSLIALALWLHSRQAFLLSIWGYAVGYAFYSVLGANMGLLTYNFVGFNFILVAVSIGGFYYLPTLKTYLLVAGAVLVTAILQLAITAILLQFLLGAITLPFVMTVGLVLYTLQMSNFFAKTTTQLFSPEKNYYAFANVQQRFNAQIPVLFSLPFFGEWLVSQGHFGKRTHVGNYAYAWDTVISVLDKTYKDTGAQLDHYFCYNAPILAPANGYVVSIEHTVADNPINEPNLEQNWGNTIIIQHDTGIYTALSHLKGDSIQVILGQYVERGQHIANLGNSGRSPEPHLHLQVQSLPMIGSTTVRYPLGYYMRKVQQEWVLHYNDIPNEGDIIKNVPTSALFSKAYKLQPNQYLQIMVEQPANSAFYTYFRKILGYKALPQYILLKAEVFTDAYNLTYLYCHDTGALLYFVNDGTMFYCTNYYGSQKSPLYQFYKANYRILLSAQPNIEIKDEQPLYEKIKGVYRWLQDILLPFGKFQTLAYSSTCHTSDNPSQPKLATIHSSIEHRFFNWSISKEKYAITLKDNLIVAIQFRK